MTVETVGNPPPEAEQLREQIQKQLPEIMASFSQVLQTQFGYEHLRVGSFTIVPAKVGADSISCDEESCTVD